MQCCWNTVAPVAQCDPLIHLATQGPTLGGPFGEGDQWIHVCHISWEAMIKTYTIDFYCMKMQIKDNIQKYQYNIKPLI